MKGQTNKHIRVLKFQRRLRSHSTDAERKLWTFLRGRQMAGYKFRRQHPYLDYVLDFVCIDAKLVIEVDGGQHAGELQERRDTRRTRELEDAGFTVLRFWDNQVLQELESVKESIWNELQRNPPPSQPSP